jgi:hypothetical protein
VAFCSSQEHATECLHWFFTLVGDNIVFDRALGGEVEWQWDTGA